MSFWGQKKNCQGQHHSFWPFPPISQKSKIHHHSCRFVVFKVHIGEPWAPSYLTRFHQNITTRETCSIYQLGCSQCILQVIKTRLLSIFKRLRLSIKLNIHYHSHSLPFPPEYSRLSLQASTQSTTTPFRGSTMAEAMFRWWFTTMATRFLKQKSTLMPLSTPMTWPRDHWWVIFFRSKTNLKLFL